MYKRNIIFISIMSFLPLLSFSQQRWEIIISSNKFDYSSISFDKSYDKGYVLSAKTAWNTNLMIKMDINGTVLWTKTFINNNTSHIHRIKQNANGETLFCGIADNHPFLMFVDACGNLLWCNEFISEHYTQSMHVDAVFLENGDVVVLTDLDHVVNDEDVGLMSFDSNGNLLWFQPFNLRVKYDLLNFMLPYYLDNFNDFLIISGFCYYAYPDNPSLVWLRPMFIKTDSLYKEDWFLPYGMSDSISGDANGAISFNGTTIQGYGSYYKPNTDTINSILLNFDIDGNETSHIGIDNNELGPEVVDNFFFRLVRRDDTSYMASAKFGETVWDNPMGEWVMDSLGNVYQYQNHENTFGGNTAPVLKTENNTFLFSHQYNNSDILLYKLNADLSQAAYDTNTYVYDSLCDDLPIVSDTIYLDNCSIITAIDEIPTPQEYYSFIKTIPVRIFPNPATSGITFELGNTEKHKDIRLWCYDINGKLVFEQALPPGQTQIKTTVSGWQSGMYIAVAGSSTGGAGSAKFVVR